MTYENLQRLRKTTPWQKLRKYKTRKKVVYEGRRSLNGLDGRVLNLRSSHAALNTLLQSAGALVCKQWMVEFHQLLKEHHLDQYVRQVAWVHDEVVLECNPFYAQAVSDLCVSAIQLAGTHFNIRCPLTGQAQIGKTWKDVH